MVEVETRSVKILRRYTANRGSNLQSKINHSDFQCISIEREESTCKARKCARERISNAVAANAVGNKPPSYIPNYVRPIQPAVRKQTAHCSADSTSTFSKRVKVLLSTSQVELPCERKKNDSGEKVWNTLAKGRFKSPRKSNNKDKFEEVRVKDVIAVMESRIQNLQRSLAGKSTKPVKPPKPVLPDKPSHLTKPYIRRPKKNTSETAPQTTGHRRSLSDPSIEENNFKQMKELWNLKSGADVDSCQKDGSPSHVKHLKKEQEYKRRGSSDDILFEAASITRETNRNNFGRSVSPSPKNFSAGGSSSSSKVPPTISNDNRATESMPRRPALQSRQNALTPSTDKAPLIPPRPGAIKGHSNSDLASQMPSADVTSSQSNSLSVNEKAMMFGSRLKPSPKKESKRQTGNSSFVADRYIPSRPDGSGRKPVPLEKKSSNDGRYREEWAPYARQRNTNDTPTAKKDWRTKGDDSSVEEEDLRKPPWRTKGLQAKRSSVDSNASEDDDRRSIGRRSSMDVNGTSGMNPLVAGGAAHGRSSKPGSFKNESVSSSLDDQVLDASKRMSSLQSAIESKQFDPDQLESNGAMKENRIKNTAGALDGALVKTSFLHNSLSQASPETGRNRSRALHSGEPPATPPELPKKNPPELPSKGPPELPKKAHRKTSRVGSGKEKSHPPPFDVCASPSPPLVPEHRKPKETKSLSLTRGTAPAVAADADGASNNFNPLKMYNEAAKEVSDEDSKPRSSSMCSSLSIDSGFRTSLEVPPQSSNMAEWSDFDNSDEDDSVLGPSQTGRSPNIRAPSPSPPQQKETNEVKLHNIAKELLSTEESYVSILHLIDQGFHKQIREAAIYKHIMPEQAVNNIFCHVPAIYRFHSSFLLPQLRQRLQDWETKPRIGDIMTQAAPFLKMYTLYVQNFDEAMNTIKLWSEKSPAFKAILVSIQKTPECNFLTLQHHMLGPVQRVPRYKLLLTDYMKRLPEDSDDRQEAETALKLITVAAAQANETMKKIEKFHKLVSIFNNLADVNFDIVDVTRELLKEGKIIKISARNGEKYERYLYLFSDMLLCCTPIRRLQGKAYKVTAKIDLEGMKISQVKNPTVSFAFCVNGLQKSMEFATTSAEDTEAWVESIQGAIDELENRRQTFRSFAAEHGAPDDATAVQTDGPPGTPTHKTTGVREEFFVDISDADLGTRAPRWVKDHEVTMCMICSKAFNKLIRRRHHCRACGRVVCGECSENKHQLQYDPAKPQKVCTRCYDIFNGQRNGESTDAEKNRGVLEVEADIVNENSIIADYLHYCDNEKKKTWLRMWCVIPRNELCLYFYGARQDIKAQMTLPLPGFEVIKMDSTTEHRYAFKLRQGRRTIAFASDDLAVVDRWKYALTKAGVGESSTREEVHALGLPMESDSDWSD